MRDGIERLIPQGCIPPPTTMSVALIKAPGFEAKGLSAVSERKEEAHEREQVGLVRVQALLQEQQVELAQSRKHRGEGGKGGAGRVSSFRIHLARRTRGSASVARTRASFAQAKRVRWRGLLCIAT